MAFEIVQVVANGNTYEGWESCVVVADMQAVYAYCQLMTTETGGLRDKVNSAFDVWNFPPGTPIQVLATGTPVFSGIVDSYQPTVDATSHNITVTAKTESKNFAESSVKHPNGVIENTADIDVVKLLAANHGTSLTSYAKPDIIPYWQFKQGASNYQESMRILQQRAKMLWTNLHRGLVITDGTAFGFVTDGALVEGVNILKETAILTDQMWSLIQVIGQYPVGVDDKQHLQPFGVATSPFADTNRYKRIIDQAATTMELARIRAQWEMQRSLADNLQAQITVPGWRTMGTSGDIWDTNVEVYVFAPYLKIDCILRITKTLFTQDNTSGTTTTLTLVDPASLGDIEPQPCNSDDLWKRFLR